MEKKLRKRSVEDLGGKIIGKLKLNFSKAAISEMEMNETNERF